MKDKHLYMAWGGLFVLCAALGFIPEPEGLLKAVMVLLAALFFLPAAVLLYRGIRHEDRKTVCRVRNLSALSLGLTLLVLIANFLSVMAPETVGNLLYYLLIVVSSPMVCSQYWAVSLFIWACLLFTAITKMPKKA